MQKTDKIKLLKIFESIYPDPKSELNFSNSYQLWAAVLLSAQCTDKKVNQVTPILFEQFPDFKSLALAKQNQIEKIIRPINYYKTKSKHLIAGANLVVEKYNSKLPKTHHELTSIAGVGQKTANVILSELGLAKTFPVDTHVLRVSKRLGLASGKNPKTTEEELKLEFDQDLWRPLHHWLIFHGRRVCKAQNPNCTECQLNDFCPSVITNKIK